MSPSTSSETSSTTKDVNLPEPTCEHSKVVVHLDDPEEDIDFVTLHNILYYLYTKCANLRLGRNEYPPNKKTHPPGYPDRPDPFELYKSAKKYLLTSLSDYCFKYLKATLTDGNVVERLFRQDCQIRNREELRDLYLEYLMTNYDKVKKTEDWRRVVLGDENFDHSVSEFHKELFFGITERLTYVSTITTPTDEQL